MVSSETESADRAPAHGKGAKPLSSRLSDLYNRVTNPKKEKKKDMTDVEAAKKEVLFFPFLYLVHCSSGVEELNRSCSFLCRRCL